MCSSDLLLTMMRMTSDMSVCSTLLMTEDALRMQFYIDYAAKIYGIYLKYVAKEDIYVYSIDEVFIDLPGRGFCR